MAGRERSMPYLQSQDRTRQCIERSSLISYQFTAWKLGRKVKSGSTSGTRRREEKGRGEKRPQKGALGQK